jgi:predicted P-loop ATPase/GTPase
MTEPRPIWIADYSPSLNGEPLSTKQLHEVITSQSMTIDKLYSEVGRLNDVIGLLRNWVKAYPLDMFPEPDLKLARKLLEDGGVNYSALNVYSMRHVINGVGKIIDEALGKVNE